MVPPPAGLSAAVDQADSPDPTGPPAPVGDVAAVVAPARSSDPRAERSRQALLAAAADLVAESGWGAVTVEALSVRSGVARTTIYRHWPDMSHLLIEAAELIIDRCEEPDTGTLRGDLTMILHGLAHTLTASPSAGIFPSMIDAAERDPAIADLQRTFTHQRRSASRLALLRAEQRGEIPAGYDVAVEAALTGGPLFYRRLIAREPLTPEFLARVVDAACARLGAP